MADKTLPERVIVAFKRRTVRKLKKRSPVDRLKARLYYRKNKVKLRLKRKRYIMKNHLFHGTHKLFKRSTPPWLGKHKVTTVKHKKLRFHVPKRK